MNLTLRFLFVVAFSITYSQSALAKCPQTALKVSVAGVYLSEFLFSAKAGLSQAIPFPPQVCLEKGMAIEIIDTYGAVAGTLRVADVWSGIYKDSTVLQISDVNSPPRLLRQDLLKRKLNDQRSVRAILALNFQFNTDLSSQIQIVKGSFQKTTGYAFNWNIFTSPDDVKFYPIIDYSGVISSLTQGAVVYSAGGGVLTGQDFWRIPGALKGAPISEPARPMLYSWVDLINSLDALERTFSGRDKSKLAIVYSPPDGSALAYNTMDLLRVMGYKDIRWFQGGAIEWNNPIKTQRHRVHQFENEIDAKGVLALVKANSALILDVRPHALYQLKKIPTSMNSALIYRPQRGAGNLDRPDRPVLVSNIASLIGSRKDIVVYLDGDAVGPLVDAVSVLKNQTKNLLGIKIHVYRGGFSDWFAHSIWSAADGFTVN